MHVPHSAQYTLTAIPILLLATVGQSLVLYMHLSKTDCRLCYWFTVLCDTLSGIGVVAAGQITSVYLFYSAVYLTVSPTLALAWVSSFAAIIASSLVHVHNNSTAHTRLLL